MKLVLEVDGVPHDVSHRSDTAVRSVLDSVALCPLAIIIRPRLLTAAVRGRRGGGGGGGE